MELNNKQTKAMDEIHEQFKLGLKEANIDEDDWDICQVKKGKDEDSDGDLRPKNSIKIGGFEIASSTTSLKKVENCMVRFINRCEAKIPSYIG